MKIKNIDHIVIPVSDIDKSLHFYTEVLGMEADICLLTEGNIEEIKVEVESKGIEIEVGIVQRRGAQGAIRSIYFRDPDGNLIEVSTLI